MDALILTWEIICNNVLRPIRGKNKSEESTSQVGISQTPKKISEPKNYFMYRNFITKNSIFGNFESKNISRFPRIINMLC